MRHTRGVNVPSMALDRQQAAALAARQHGIVTTSQLRRLGASSAQVARMRERGDLHRVHRGVWSYGHPRRSPHADLSAARLGAREDASVAGHGASWIWRISRRGFPRYVEVVTPRRCRRRLRSVGVRQMEDLDSRAVWVDGIRVLTVTWTIVDLVGRVPRGELVRLISQAAYRKVLDLDELRTVAAELRGGAQLRAAILAYEAGEHGSDSALEEDVVAWLPDPPEDPRRQNVYIDGPGWRYRVDIAYLRARVVVEPGGPHHDFAPQQRRDARRWRDLRADGWTVVPIREPDFVRDPRAATEPARIAVAVGLARLEPGRVDRAVPTS